MAPERSRPVLVAAGGIVIGAALLVSAWAFVRVYPYVYGLFPPCLFHELTGLHCTGCGGTRAVHALLSGDLATAWAQNPLLLLLLPWIGYGLVRGLGRYFFPGREFPGIDVPGKLYWVLAWAVILFTVVRNLPFVHGLGPLP